ncbi:MAG: response regulator [Firmicutes bacterium]|jgi:DNA-binding NtrC family response regulator|nr:response regulator [Bacillota bacterium]MCL5065303.1 response regulator [Bacillota bacterium]
MQVWVVDDESGILQVIEAVLLNAGHEVRTFSNVASLDQMIASDRPDAPDLLLIDARLGGESGLETAERLRREVESFSHVVIMSGDSEVADTIPPTIKWLRKPFRLDQLLQLLDALDSA